MKTKLIKRLKALLWSAGMSDWTPTPAWYEFTFDTPVVVAANTNYWIKATGLTGSTNDVFRWSNDNTSPSYSLGSTWYLGSAVTGNDCNFRISGNVAGGSNSGFLMFL